MEISFERIQTFTNNGSGYTRHRRQSTTQRIQENRCYQANPMLLQRLKPNEIRAKRDYDLTSTFINEKWGNFFP